MAQDLRIGVIGIGNAGSQVVPTVEKTEGVALTAVADVRPDALEAFRAQHPDVQTFESTEALCQGNVVDAVWVATPSELHAQCAVAAAERGKHVVCEKPMAIALEDCDRMIDAVHRNGVKFIMHSKSSDPPVRKMREIAAGGDLGRLISLNTWNYKGWLNSPRRADELDTSRGGGIVFRQAPHQIEIVRCIGGGQVKSVHAVAGRWNPYLDTEGNFTAFLQFADGTPATMVLNCYGYFSMTDLTWGIGEGGTRQGSSGGTRPRRERATGPVEPELRYALRAQERQGRADLRDQERKQPFYGLTLVSCERGDMRQSQDGVYVYTDDGCQEIRCSPYLDRGAELQQLRSAVVDGKPIFADEHWGKASLEVVLAILESSAQHREVEVKYQTATPI